MDAKVFVHLPNSHKSTIDLVGRLTKGVATLSRVAPTPTHGLQVPPRTGECIKVGWGTPVRQRREEDWIEKSKNTPKGERSEMWRM